MRRVFLCIISCFSLTLSAQEGPVINEPDIVDSVAYNPDEDTSFIFLPDSEFRTLTIDFEHPAHEIYLIWDTVIPNPYQIDLSDMCDTVILDLTGENTSAFSMPVPGNIVSPFGFRRYRYHYGIDLKLNIGDTVVAAFDGVVRYQKFSRTYGNYVVIRHRNGLETLYAHLKETKVINNQEVRAGELIGLGGSTGRSTGPHLHFEVRYLGQPFNPEEIIDFYGCSLKSRYYFLDNSTFSFLPDVKKIRYYKIRRGDTLGKIAHKYGVTVRYLCRLNNIKPTTILRIGRYIRYS